MNFDDANVPECDTFYDRNDKFQLCFDNENEAFKFADSSILSTSPSVILLNNNNNFLGGKIANFAHVWLQFAKGRWTRATLAGRILEFNELPCFRRTVCPLRLSQQDQQALDSALAEYLRCGIIEEVCDVNEESYVSNVFPVVKRDGLSARVILNLKSLNPYIKYEHFKMDSLTTILPLITQDCWFASLDLMNAYFSVPVTVKDRRWLRFWHYDKLFQYTCLPQGLTSAPRIFTRLLKPIMGHLRSIGITAIIYIDDCLIIAPSKEAIVDHVIYVSRLFDSLGLTINVTKSQISPVQVINYLGFMLNSIKMDVTLSSRKVIKIRDLGNFVLASTRVSVRLLSSFIGNLVAAGPGVPVAPVRYKYLELVRNRALVGSRGDYEAKVTLDTHARQLVLWWTNNIHLQSRSLLCDPVSVVLTTDASLSGWGACVGSTETGGHWAHGEKEHINILELKAVFLGLQSLCSGVRDSHIRIVSDNTTVIACIERGGSIRPRLLEVTEQIYVWAFEHSNSLSAEFLKGVENVNADRLSREVVYSTEWKLDPIVFSQLCARYGMPGVDLFATRLNYQVPIYVSWRPDPLAFRVDAFSFIWNFDTLFYAFPPFSLVSRLLRKVEQEQAEVLLVAPIWATQIWFPLLLNLLVEVPLVLPPGCVSLPQDISAVHPLGKRLRLAAMRISGDPLKREVFRRGLQTFYATPGELARRSNIDGTWIDGWNFVSDGKMIRFVRM